MRSNEAGKTVFKATIQNISIDTMAGGNLGRKGETILECPFCHKGNIRVFHKEGYLQPKVSRISSGAKTTYHRVPDTYQVLESCPNCGKSKKDIELKFEGKYMDEKKMKERVEPGTRLSIVKLDF